MSDTNPYRLEWDSYAKRWHRNVLPDRPLGEDSWPGDEWGDEERWSQIFETMFLRSGAKDWLNCVEIGPGSGKYTSLLIKNSNCNVIAFDISPAYLGVMTNRLAKEIQDRRVEPALIRAEKSSEILDYLATKNLVRKLDAFYSIDAMVHVDLQYLVVYFLTAALALRENGLMIMTLANAVSEEGFTNLIDQAKYLYTIQGEPSQKFEYLSPDIVNTVLGKMGFEVHYASPFGQSAAIDRDLSIVARLVDTKRAETFRSAISD